MRPDFSLEGRTALVTGSVGGLGLVIARAYAESGATVIINGRTRTRAEEAAAHLQGGGFKAFPFVQDMADLPRLPRAYEELCHRVGVPDILVNNVGIRIRKSLSAASEAEIARLLSVDLIAPVHLSRLAAQSMVGLGTAGRIITMTSIAGPLARAGDAIYPIAKQGLEGLVRALAVEYGPLGITSNGIAPGTFATESNAALVQDAEASKAVIGRNPLGRWGRPAEIAGAAVFLASGAASYVNGHILVVDGGYSVAF